MSSLRTVSVVALLTVLQLSWGAPQANAQGWYMDVSIYSDSDPDESECYG